MNSLFGRPCGRLEFRLPEAAFRPGEGLVGQLGIALQRPVRVNTLTLWITATYNESSLFGRDPVTRSDHGEKHLLAEDERLESCVWGFEIEIPRIDALTRKMGPLRVIWEVHALLEPEPPDVAAYTKQRFTVAC